MVAPHPTLTDAAEGEIERGIVDDGIVDIDAARGGLLDYPFLLCLVPRKEIECQRLGPCVDEINRRAEIVLGDARQYWHEDFLGHDRVVGNSGRISSSMGPSPPLQRRFGQVGVAPDQPAAPVRSARVRREVGVALKISSDD